MSLNGSLEVDLYGLSEAPQKLPSGLPAHSHIGHLFAKHFPNLLPRTLLTHFLEPFSPTFLFPDPEKTQAEKDSHRGSGGMSLEKG